VESFSFLGTTITQYLKWELNISSITKKGPADDVLPAAAKEVQPAKDNDGALNVLFLKLHLFKA